MRHLFYIRKKFVRSIIPRKQYQIYHSMCVFPSTNWALFSRITFVVVYLSTTFCAYCFYVHVLSILWTWFKNGWFYFSRVDFYMFSVRYRVVWYFFYRKGVLRKNVLLGATYYQSTVLSTAVKLKMDTKITISYQVSSTTLTSSVYGRIYLVLFFL